MQCHYNSFIQVINCNGLFRNALRCRKIGALPNTHALTVLCIHLAHNLQFWLYRPYAYWLSFQKGDHACYTRGRSEGRWSITRHLPRRILQVAMLEELCNLSEVSQTTCMPHRQSCARVSSGHTDCSGWDTLISHIFCQHNAMCDAARQVLTPHSWQIVCYGDVTSMHEGLSWLKPWLQSVFHYSFRVNLS